jgi:tetratricopeptide (TPR) repeat protein
MEKETIAHTQALILLDQAYRQHMQGNLGEAIVLYERSIALHATPEAHTRLGWAWRLLGRHDAAIAECHKAIALDSGYGNPYNDIGVCLIEKGQWQEAGGWFEQALRAERYDATHFAWFNLGRVHAWFGRNRAALHAWDRALEIEPLYRPALYSRFDLIARLN